MGIKDYPSTMLQTNIGEPESRAVDFLLRVKRGEIRMFGITKTKIINITHSFGGNYWVMTPKHTKNFVVGAIGTEITTSMTISSKTPTISKCGGEKQNIT